jgi:transposase
MWRANFKMKDIIERLAEEGVKVSRTAVHNLLTKFKKTESVGDIKRRARSRRLSAEHYRHIDELMAENTDLTSRQLFSALKEAYPTVEMSLSTVKRARRYLGWTAKRTRYCQLISDVNKEKRMEWCLDRVISDDLDLEDVIWTDECSVQLESHRKITYHKQGEPSKMVSRPKHPPKVHVWAGISAKGATSVVIFTGVLIATRYTDILEAALKPFIVEHYPEHHRFQQDNDPKHTSRWAQNYFEESNINWWRTPPSSPDLNPIENVWGSMKTYLRTYAKPKSTDELRAGIKAFWKTLTPSVCKRYIGHLRRVIPKVIEVDGAPSGY